LLALVAPHYSKGETGRKPVGLAIMLRVYFVQQWFALSDPGVEDALYESPVLRHFVGIDLGRAPAPDETTILNFRHLLEEHELCGEMLDTVICKTSAHNPALFRGSLTIALVQNFGQASPTGWRIASDRRSRKSSPPACAYVPLPVHDFVLGAQGSLENAALP
jgi:IS5 family transposase